MVGPFTTNRAPSQLTARLQCSSIYYILYVFDLHEQIPLFFISASGFLAT